MDIWLAGECKASERELMQFAVFKEYFGSIFGLIATNVYLMCLLSLMR